MQWFIGHKCNFLYLAWKSSTPLKVKMHILLHAPKRIKLYIFLDYYDLMYENKNLIYDSFKITDNMISNLDATT